MATRLLRRSFKFSVGGTAEAKGSVSFQLGQRSPPSSSKEPSSSKATFTANAQWGNSETGEKSEGFADRWKSFWAKIQSK